MTTPHDLNRKRVFENGVTDWYVAESAEQAASMLRADNAKETGPNVPESELDCEFTACPDEMVLTIDPDGDGEEESRTCAEWAAISPLGFLATTEY